MQFDLGFTGAAVLVGCALLFGVVAHVLVGRDTRWMWLIGALGWLVGGIVASEVLLGGLTEEEIQPIIDGLAFDESLLGGLVGGLSAAVAFRLAVGPASRTAHATR